MTDPVLALYAASRPSPERVRSLVRGVVKEARVRGYLKLAEFGARELSPVEMVARKGPGRQGGETRERRQA